MKIAWLSASPTATTGYGTQSYEVCSRLMTHHEVTCIARTGDVIVWGGRQKKPTPNGDLTVVTLGSMASAEQMINDIYLPEFKFDMIIGFMDAFGIEFLNNVKIPVVGWIPIDGPFTETWAHHVRNYYKIFAYSMFGFKELQKWFPPSKVGYIPHAVSEDFYPLTKEEKQKTRDDLGIPQDVFLVVNVGANVGPRKELPLMMMTFARFVEKIIAEGEDPPHLYLHTNAFQLFPRGYDLITWRRMMKMEKYVHFPPYNPIINPASNEELNRLHNTGDIYTQNSVAEGYGLPIAEALATATPVGVPLNSAQVELVYGFNGKRRHGWGIKCLDPDVYVQIPVYVPQLPTYPVPDQRSLLDVWMKAYHNPHLRERYGRAGHRFIEDNLRWDTAMPKWFNALNEIEEEFTFFDALYLGLTGGTGISTAEAAAGASK